MSRDRAAEPAQTIADVMNGLSFGGGRKRDRPVPVDPVPVDLAPPRPAAVVESGGVEPGGVRSGGVRPGGVWPGLAEPAGSWPATGVEPAPAAAADTAIVRPYAWTRGRTRSTFELRLETMVSTGDRPPDSTAFAESEHRAIGALCRDPRSVAEVATLLGAPLGVAKVLLGDMAQLGLVTVHKTAGGGANRAHLVLMERVLSGLRRL